MAWANKYRFRFDSVHGVEYNIYILKDGYSGQVIQRKLGRAPVLKKKQNGPICGTSLELWAECAVDGEFAELYTSDPKEYKVEVYRAGTLIWFGFVSTELYSEPSIAPPYDVQIVATDGLGELKLNDFSAMGEASLKAILFELLSFTGSDRPMYFATNLKVYGGNRTEMPSWTIDIDFLDGETCYDVLTKLMDTLHATITAYGDHWLIAMETDIETLLSNSGALSVLEVSTAGTVSNATITGVRKTLGQKGVAAMWPNGNLSTAIEPARNSVVVKAPWHMKQIMNGADLTQQSSAAYWSKDNFQTLDSRDLQWKDSTHYQHSGYYVGDCLTGNNYGYIKQSFSLSNINGLSYKVEVKVRPAIVYDINIWAFQHGSLLVYLKYTDTTGEVYWCEQKGWGTLNNVEYTDIGHVDTDPEQTFTFNVPAFPGRTTGSGTLELFVSGRNFHVTYANLAFSRPEEGYQDTIIIDNGARGKDNDVELIACRSIYGDIQNENIYQGLWRNSLGVIYAFEDSHHANADFMSLQALDRAISVALARTKTEGLVDVPTGVSALPLIVRQGSQDSWINTWDWDLLAEDVKISALSMPNAAITIDSEVVQPIEPGSGSSSGGGSGSGGSGGSSAGGTSLIRVWRSLTNDNDLTDFNAETKIALAHLSSYFDLNEYTTGHFALKVKPSVQVGGNTVTVDGLFTDGFLTAGGVGPSGGGGGIDLDRVWDSLTNNTDKPDVKINAAHIPIASALAVGGIKVGSGLSIAQDGTLSATGGATGTVTGVRVGSGGSTLSPDSGGVVTIPDYGISNGTITINGTSITPLTAVPKATSSVIGGFQTGFTENGQYYAVNMSGNKAYVYVPWTDNNTTYKLNINGSWNGDSTSGTSLGTVYAPTTAGTQGYGLIANSNGVPAWTDLSGIYLPLSGGTLTGDLRLKGSTNYGLTLRFGNLSYAYISNDDNRHLAIYAQYGISLSTGSDSYPITFGNAATFNGGLTIDSAKTLTLGTGVLKWDSNNSAWHLEGNFYADGFITAGGIGSTNTQLVTIDGTQTISGAKTFSAVTTFSNSVSVASGKTLTAPAITATNINPGSSYINLAPTSGYVTIGGTTSSTIYKLYVTGSAYASGSFINGSDRRLKDNIKLIPKDEALAKLMALKPSTWNWKENGKAGSGFVAQDVMEIIPSAVHGGYGEDFLGLDYAQFHPIEVAVIQGLVREIEELKRRLGYVAQ